MSTKLRRNHLAVAGILFMIAIALYAAGHHLGAIAATALGVVVELAAWLALATDKSHGEFPPTSNGQ